MTCIAYDGTTLATDSQVGSGSLVFGKMNKITKLKDGRYLASTGDICLIPEVIDWLNGGDKPEKTENSTFLGLVIGPNKQTFEIDKEYHIYPICIPWAGGSGETIALTAMMCGKTAVEAVKIACKLDVYSGLPVKKITIKE